MFHPAPEQWLKKSADSFVVKIIDGAQQHKLIIHLGSPPAPDPE